MLKDKMHDFMERLAELLDTFDNGRSDMHREVCIALSDEFHLWERSLDPQGHAGESFPIWVSYIVAGEMREKFPERYAGE